MSQLWKAWSSTAQFLRRNRYRVVLVSAAGLGTAAAAVYVRRQYSAFQAVLAAEREAGAGALRATYVSNSHTTQSALQALLPLLRAAVRDAPGADVDVIVRQLRAPQGDRGAKRPLWMRLQRATFAEVVGVACLMAALQTSLALQLNLLGRYSATPREVEPLPSRATLQSHTQDAFLTSVRSRLLAPPSIGAFIDEVPSETLPLKTRMGKEDVRKVCRTLAKTLLAKRPRVLAPEFLFCGAVPDADIDNEDADLTALFDESVDLAAALEFDRVVEAAAVHLIDTMLDNVTEDEWGAGIGTPCAQLLAPLHRAANVAMEKVPDTLRVLPDVERFAAAVLLSGEREWSCSVR